MGSKADRKTERYRVHLLVRYGVARDFVVEYADNLSINGLFVRGAHNLQLGSQVTAELTLPGAGNHQVTATIAHIIDDEMAKSLGRCAGAGLAITHCSPEFNDALVAYLQRLGRRAEAMVWVDDEALGLLLAAAGFQVSHAPPPENVVEQLARSQVPVVAVLINSDNAANYRNQLQAGGADELLIAVSGANAFDTLLTDLDELL